MNKFFLYEGDILRAANSKLNEVLKYWKPGMTVLNGTPDKHLHDITTICAKFKFKL